MGAFDLIFARGNAETVEQARTRADAATRRCQELRAELAQAKHAVTSLRTELETLRRCLAAGK